MSGSSVLEAAERVYGALVRRLFADLDPSEAEEMNAVFRDVCRAAHRDRGLAPALWEALRACVLATACAARERWEQSRERSARVRDRQRFTGDALTGDLRQALRLVRRQPGLSASVVATLGIALAASAAVFGVANAVLLERLPYREPERVVFLDHGYADRQGAGSVPNLVDFRRQTRAFEQVAASVPWDFNLTTGGEPERIGGLLVSANFFETLGVQVARGRGFGAAEEREGEDLVVVVSYALWQGRFAGDPELLGSTIELDGRPHEVVGIMPAGFRRGRGWRREALADAWAPLALTARRRAEGQRGNEFLDVYARLRPEVPLESAQADMDAVARSLRERFSERYTEANGWRVTLVPLHEEIAAPLRPLLLALLAAVLALLLIAASNVSGLLLARATARRLETSIRVALGASRGRLVRQLLCESAVLVALATLLGLLLARATVAVLERIDRITLPRAQPIEVDLSVVLATLVAGAAITLGCGLAPASYATARDLMQALRSRGGAALVRQRARRGLVVFQTALAVALLVGSGLLVRSLQRLEDVDLGFRLENRLGFQVLLPRVRYADAQARRSFVRRLVERLDAVPGVRRSAVVSALPLSGTHNADTPFEIEGRDARPDEPAPHAEAWSATPGYFQALGIPLLEGRLFDARDAGDSRRVVVVSRSLAVRYWPGEDAVGHRVALAGPPERRAWAEVVGIVGDVRDSSLDAPPRPQLYSPYEQAPYAHFYAVVHAETPPESLAAIVRGAVLGIDAQQPIFDVTTLERLRRDDLADRRAGATTLGILGGAAIGLAMLGLYGVLAFSVRERRAEIGVRMALGAGSGEVVRLFVREGLGLTLPGAALGCGLALLGAHLLEGLVFGVALADPLTYGAVAAIVSGVGLSACSLPAWRATRLDPVQALRAD